MVHCSLRTSSRVSTLPGYGTVLVIELLRFLKVLRVFTTRYYTNARLNRRSGSLIPLLSHSHSIATTSNYCSTWYY